MVRAEPVLSLYEQRRVAHCGDFRELEDEMLTYVPGEPSPVTRLAPAGVP
jgi:phage terminase large subunit-like protein